MRRSCQKLQVFQKCGAKRPAPSRCAVGGEGRGIKKGSFPRPVVNDRAQKKQASLPAFSCTRSRGRTGTALRPLVFETSASTDSAIRAIFGKRGNKCSYFFLVMKPKCFFDFRMQRIGNRTGLCGGFYNPFFTVSVCASVREVYVYNNFSYTAG